MAQKKIKIPRPLPYVVYQENSVYDSDRNFIERVAKWGARMEALENPRNRRFRWSIRIS